VVVKTEKEVDGNAEDAKDEYDVAVENVEVVKDEEDDVSSVDVVKDEKVVI